MSNMKPIYLKNVTGTYLRSYERTGVSDRSRRDFGVHQRRWGGVVDHATTVGCGRCSGSGMIWVRPSPKRLDVKTCPVCEGKGKTHI